MLLQLRIENLATIDEIEIEFFNGFSILTGETGAGKSIMIDAILIILGSRGDPGIIRTGREKAIVEAIFCDIKPDFPIPRIISLPLHSKIELTASSNSLPILSAMAATA